MRWPGACGVDSLTDVHTSLGGNNCIVTVIDHILKRVHLNPFTKSIDNVNIPHLCVRSMMCIHRGPWEMTSDGATHLMSDSRAEVSITMQTELLISSVFHPQTDMLSEILNKQVIQYVQAFTIYFPDHRDTMLPLAEYTYNMSSDWSADRSTLELDQHFTPRIPLDFVLGQQ